MRATCSACSQDHADRTREDMWLNRNELQTHCVKGERKTKETLGREL